MPNKPELTGNLLPKTHAFDSNASTHNIKTERVLINGISLLETECSNGQMHHVLVINFQVPPYQEIERRPGPCDAGTEVRPHAMAHFLAMKNGREQRPYRFDHHPRVPGPAQTDFYVVGSARLGMEAGVR